jgi:hypothetical protein
MDRGRRTLTPANTAGKRFKGSLHTEYLIAQ